MLKESKLKINENTQIKVDKGFLGILKLFGNAQVPFKASKHKPLTKEQKEFNQQLAKERILIEHINRECKIFRIYRGKHKNYERTWKLVASIVNLKRATRHLKFATP